MPVPASAQTVDHRTTMTAPATTQSVDHQTRFQAAVDVIQNLPKDGAYRPSYEVMLRFYGLYKQAVFGPCQASRPGFWDPVGRYKWDAWSRLGAMSSEHAMGQYVDEMKKVAQEIIDTVPMNEKTASVFHHFEPLYVVIDDMPRPPPSLLRLRGDVKDSDGHQGRAEDDRGASEEPASGTPALEPALEPTPGPGTTSTLEPAPEPTPALEPAPEPTPAPETMPALEPAPENPALEPAPENPALEPAPETSVLEPSPENPAPEQDTGQAQEVAAPSTTGPQGLSEGVVLTSDSESEVFLDSVDSVELLNDVKAEVPTSNGLHNGHAYPEHPPPAQTPREEEAVSQATQVGAGQGGEGAEDGKGPPMRRSRDAGREGTHQGWRERGMPPDSPRRAGRGAGRGAGPGGGAGGGGGGGAGGPEGGPDRPQDSQVQQQIVLALRRLREDMRSVMDRLEVVERLTAAHAQSPDWRPCRLCAASSSDSEPEDGGRRWWPSDVSGRTLLLLLLWPFVAQGLVVLLRRTRGGNGAPV